MFTLYGESKSVNAKIVYSDTILIKEVKLMAFAISINFILLMAIFFILREIFTRSNLYSKRFIITTTLLVLINSFFTYSYIQLRSSHNNSTYISYNILMDSIERIEGIDEISDSNDVRLLKNTLVDINKHIALLIKQMEHSRIAKKKDQRLIHDSLNLLANDLSSFNQYHNKLFANGYSIAENQILKYDDLRVELVKLNKELRNDSGVSYMRYGVVNHSLSFKGDQINRLEMVTKTISEIVSEITADLTCDN